MQHTKTIRAAKYGYILLSTAVAILGILLIALPGFSLPLLCRLGGGLMLLFGVVKILGYLSKDLYRLAFQYDLAFGILLILLGLVLILRPGTGLPILCILLGLLILADSLLKIQIAIDARRFGLSLWWMILSCALITGVLGLVLMVHPVDAASPSAAVLGMTLIGEGLLNLITVLTAVRIIRQKTPDRS